jgi:archaellin
MHSRLLFLSGLLSTLVRRFNAAQRGQTVLEAAVVCLVCTPCVIGGVLITTGEEAAEQLQSVFQNGIQQASGTLVLSGSATTTRPPTAASATPRSKSRP